MTFPNHTFDDDSITTEVAGLRNCVIVQRWAVVRCIDGSKFAVVSGFLAPKSVLEDLGAHMSLCRFEQIEFDVSNYSRRFGKGMQLHFANSVNDSHRIELATTDIHTRL